MPDLLDLRTEPSDGLRTPEDGLYELDDSVGEGISRSASNQALMDTTTSTSMPTGESKVEGGVAKGMARHTLGMILLLCVVFLWTLSNFLGSVRSTLLASATLSSN